jgi:hypothetical protein
VSGTPVVRPKGQIKPGDAPEPFYAACRALDYELELGIVIGMRSELGRPVPVGSAAESVFGFCLLNDWSARDIQAWEYQPLGPFLGKNFSTTISPWIVTSEALAPYRTHAYKRPEGDPAPLPYLTDAADQAHGGIAIELSAHIRTAKIREQGIAAFRLSRSPFESLYWTPAQMIAHHTGNGCNLRSAISSAPALCPARTGAAGAACWNCRRAGASRSNCRAAKSAASSRTATRSLSAATARARALPASASASAAAWCCRRISGARSALTSPRLRGEVGSHRRCEPGEGDSQRVRMCGESPSPDLALLGRPLPASGER